MLETIKNFINDQLEAYEGQKVYACDLGYLLTEEINVNGSVHCSTYAAIETIKENFELCSEVFEYMKTNLGMVINPFEEPEKFEVCLYIECVNNLLSQSEIINAKWNEEIKLNKNTIGRIKREIKDKEFNF
ncbi:MAG: hypothetical protein LIR50_04300 [Bacillota bacterium]|nr:hypothetical protein [Bacillota bacterium]